MLKIGEIFRCISHSEGAQVLQAAGFPLLCQGEVEMSTEVIPSVSAHRVPGLVLGSVICGYIQTHLVASINTHVLSHSSGGQGSACGLLGQSLTRPQSRCQLVLRYHLETIWGRSASKLMYVAVGRSPFLAGCWNEGLSGAAHSSLSWGPLRGQLTAWQLTSSEPARGQVGWQGASYHLTLCNHGSDIYHLGRSLLVRSKS